MGSRPDERLEVPDLVKVESEPFNWQCPKDPDDGEKVEAEEARFGGAAVGQDVVEGEAVADEAHDDEDCKEYMSAVVIFRACKDALTGVVCVDQNPDTGREEYEKECEPAAICSSLTSHDAIEPVSGRLNDNMKEHLQGGGDDHANKVDGCLTSLLRCGGAPSSSIRIHDICESSEDAKDRSWEECLAEDLKLDFDVAESDAAEPILEIVVPPDDRVDHALNVGKQNARYESSRADVSVAVVLDECWQVQDRDEQAEGCQHHCKRVGVPVARRCLGNVGDHGGCLLGIFSWLCSMLCQPADVEDCRCRRYSFLPNCNCFQLNRRRIVVDSQNDIPKVEKRDSAEDECSQKTRKSRSLAKTSEERTSSS